MGKEKEMRIARVGDSYICSGDELPEYGKLYTISELGADAVTVILENGEKVNWCYKSGKDGEWYDDLIPTELTRALI
jgi:hypothetical protein